MKCKSNLKIFKKMGIVILAATLILGGCKEAGNTGGSTAAGNQKPAAEDGVKSGNEGPTDEKENSGSDVGAFGSDSSGTESQESIGFSGDFSSGITGLDTENMFTDRDMDTSYEESKCTVITFAGSSISCDDKGVTIAGNTVTIQNKGSYILKGNLENGSVIVDAPKDDKVQLILENVAMGCQGTAPIYCRQADKVFITLAEGSSNVLTNTGEFQAIDDNNVDAALFSKCDLTLNGEGKLTISSEMGHGIVSKDDLKITGGTYEINSGNHGISGKDSVRIANGDIAITCKEDALHSGNDEDADKGYVYIEGGNLAISAGDDGIHGESKLLITGGKIDIQKSYEGFEAPVIEIAGGDIRIVSEDDGINAADGSGDGFGFGGRPGGFGRSDRFGWSDLGEEEMKESSIILLISGGRTEIISGGDGVDSNNNLYVTGGEVYVSGPENSGNGALDFENSGEITGGKLVAVGSSGMAMNFSSAKQGTALVTCSSVHSSGDKVVLTDDSGNTLLEYTPVSRFNSVAVSCPEMKQGETYWLKVGSETIEITLDDLIYGNSSGFGGGLGGHGGFGGKGDFGGSFEGRPEMPGDFDGSFEGRPEMPGDFDGSFEGRPEKPGDFDGSFEGRPEKPGDFDGSFEGRPGKPDNRNGNKGDKTNISEQPERSNL